VPLSSGSVDAAAARPIAAAEEKDSQNDHRYHGYNDCDDDQGS
jgi:hypothetical protein